jgi:hypothetical protein
VSSCQGDQTTFLIFAPVPLPEMAFKPHRMARERGEIKNGQWYIDPDEKSLWRAYIAIDVGNCAAP